MSCNNCKKRFSIFKKRLSCIECKQQVCSQCYYEDPENIEILLNRGWCWKCLIEIQTLNPVEKRSREQALEEIKSNSLIIMKSPFSDYSMIKTIHVGITSTIHLVRSVRTKEQYIAKQILLRSVSSEKIQAEFLFGHKCKSKNIVKNYKLYKYDDSFYIISKYMEMTLAKFIEHYRDLKESLIIYIIKGIVQGLDLIHSNNIMHRDLKPDNIFIDKKGRIRIGDFGEIGELFNCNELSKSIRGSPLYMAPEIINQTPYNYLCDIWSLGIIMLELTSSEIYGKNINISTILELSQSNETPKMMSQCSRNLINLSEDCLQKNYEMRPNTKQILSRTFMSRAKDKSKTLKRMIEKINR